MKHSIETVCTMLKGGEVVALPTETVYGLAASLDHPDAINKIFTIKNRPQDNPLIIHAASFDQLQQYCAEMPPKFLMLLDTFWPGPLTVVLKADQEKVPENVRAGLETVALRVPSHPLTLQVLQEVGPLVMPSANLSGKPSATRPEHVEIDFGLNFPVLDGGICHLGTESTVICFRYGRWELARLGAISPEELGQVLGYVPCMLPKSMDKPISPGQKYRHYAPKAVLVLDRTLSPETVGVVLGFSDRKYPESCKVISLGSTANAAEAVKNLYHVLRQLDQEQVDVAWVDMDFPKAGLWLTLAERLHKASHK